MIPLAYFVDEIDQALDAGEALDAARVAATLRELLELRADPSIGYLALAVPRSGHGDLVFQLRAFRAAWSPEVDASTCSLLVDQLGRVTIGWPLDELVAAMARLVASAAPLRVLQPKDLLADHTAARPLAWRSAALDVLYAIDGAGELRWQPTARFLEELAELIAGVAGGWPERHTVVGELLDALVDHGHLPALDGIDEPRVIEAALEALEERRCRSCGCTHARACREGCGWSTIPSICTRCADV